MVVITYFMLVKSFTSAKFSPLSRLTTRTIVFLLSVQDNSAVVSFCLIGFLSVGNRSFW